MFKLLKKIFKTSNDRTIQRMMVSINEINDLEDQIQEKPESYFKELKHELNSRDALMGANVL